MKTVTYDENEWQLVPKIPTCKMDGAGEDAYKDNGHCDCGNYAGCSMEEVYSAMLAVAPAAQDSAPAELPPLSIKTWQERLREKFPETADRNLFAVGHLEHAMEAEIAELRAALSRPVVAIPEGWKLVPLEPTDEMCDEVITEIGGFLPGLCESAEIYKAMLATAPASPQPVAKVLTPEQAWKVISKALGYSDSHRGRTMLIEFLEEAVAIADAILAAASTPTTLTEKKE